VLRTDLTDHRGTDDARLLSAVADGDAIALAEAYHRTVTAAHACARRMLASPVEIEALMRAVYSDLWEDPPVDTSLEGWVRARCFNLGAGYLRQRNLRAPSSSLAAYTSGVEADSHQGGNDSLERIIAELTDKQREALVRAHDQGIRTAEQDDAEAGWSLLHALLVLASPLTDDERHAAEMCSSGVALANWIFGLLPPHEASTVPGTAAEPTPCGRLAGVLRRARRRFEPLPPTPDLGHRVLASVLSSGAGRQASSRQGSSLDSDLRVAYADLGRSQPLHDEPPSSLDMNVPTAVPAHTGDPSGFRGDNGQQSALGWDDEDDDQPTPLRAAGPPALAPSTPPRRPRPSSALAPAPDPDDPASEDLVRMPLRRSSGRSPLAPDTDSGGINGGPAASPTPASSPPPPGDPSILRPGAPTDDDATIPPAGLRSRRGEDDRRGPPPGGMRGFDTDDGPAASPLSPEERRRQPGGDPGAESPLRRPAPQGRGFDSRPGDRQAPPPPPRALDTNARSPRQPGDSAPSPFQRDDSQPPPRQRDDSAPSPFQRDDSQPPPRQRDDSAPSPFQRDDSRPPPRQRDDSRPPPRQRDDSAPSPFQRDDSAPSPFQRDDSAPSPFQRDDSGRSPFQRDDSGPRFGGPFGGADDDATVPPSTNPAATTTAAMPAVRRRDGAPPPHRPAPHQQAGAVMMEEEETTGGASVLRWIIVLVLIALGAAFGIWLGQTLIGG
jgi:DNA-directed RNA polymerase specialized sigma24 family protein